MWGLKQEKVQKYCFTSTETVALLGTGAQDIHLDFHTLSELSKVQKSQQEYL